MSLEIRGTITKIGNKFHRKERDGNSQHEMADLGSPSSHPEDISEPSNTAFVQYLGTVVNIRNAVDSYAYWKTLKTGIPSVEIRGHEQFKDTRRTALEAVFSLNDALAERPEEKPEILKEFQREYGETSQEYEDLYKKASMQAATNSGESLASDFASVLKDRSISRQRKKELIRQAFSTTEMSKKEVAKLSAKLVGAAGATLVFAATAEPAAIAASAYGASHPFLEGLSIPNSVHEAEQMALSLGVDVSLIAGFYGATWLYAKQNIRMLKETGFGPNVFAATAYHVGGVLQSEKVRNRAVMGAVFGVNLAADIPYCATVAVPHAGPSMVAGVYAVGIGYTLAQAALSEPIIQIAKSRNKRHAERRSVPEESAIFSADSHVQEILVSDASGEPTPLVQPLQ